MRIRTIGVVSLVAALALMTGTDAAQAKSTKKHPGKGHCSIHKKSQEKCCDLSLCAKRGCKHAGSVIFTKGNCKTELELMKKAGMCKVLCGKGPITVFCPTDTAYSKLGKARLDDIKNDPKKLTALVKYHIVNKKLMAADIQPKGSVYTCEGEALMTNVNNGKAEVDGCLLIESDIPCANGVIHLIDDVPVPERGK
jgi:uncharacterized surface protein with fasciclin (FAS1) repeats